MRLYRDGELFKATHITGPTHNYLGLKFEPGRTSRPTLAPQCLPNDEGGSAQIDAALLEASVLKGVNEANQICGASLGVSVIEYVPTDNPKYDAYREMAAALAQNRHALDPPK